MRTQMAAYLFSLEHIANGTFTRSIFTQQLLALLLQVCRGSLGSRTLCRCTLDCFYQ